MRSLALPYRKKQQLAGYLFIAPQILGFLMFAVLPLVFSLYLVFSTWDFYNPITFTGMKNINYVFRQDIFWKSIVNTLVFVLMTVPSTLVLSLILALLCNRQLKGLTFYKSAFYLPMVTSSVAIAMVFFWIFARDYGLLVYLFDALGLESPLWLYDPFWAKVTITIMAIWLKVGYYFLVLLAGLKNISPTYYEAADIDGATAWKKLWNITIPMLSPVIFFVFVTLTIGIFNMFNEPYILTEGGPMFSTYTLNMFIYDYSFKYLRVGEAAFASWVLFLMMGTVTGLQFKFTGSVVNYDT